ncbi:unnamed protein product, partial [marine sediment metagenome]
VVINLYPFLEVTQKEGISLEEALENIDIGGPSMLRSAAKNFPYVAAISNPEQYPQVLKNKREVASPLLHFGLWLTCLASHDSAICPVVIASLPKVGVAISQNCFVCTRNDVVRWAFTQG